MALFAGHLHVASKNGLADHVIAEELPNLTDQVPLQQFGPPVALRWVTSNLLGTPRRPFRVYRRQEKYVEHSLRANPTLASKGALHWGETEMCVVTFDAQPATETSLIVEAVDVTGAPIPGQRIEFTQSQRGMFRFPLIASLRLSGEGQIANVTGVDQWELVNDDAWQLIEVVGLPFEEGQIPDPAYRFEAQGLAEPSRKPFRAALDRLTIAAALHEQPPSLSMLSLPDADWPAPVPQRILQYINEADPPLLLMLRACLLNSDDTSFGHRQADFRISRRAAGMRQRFDETFRSEESRMALPVLDMTMLAVSSDSYAATALGFGTIDFPPATPKPLDPEAKQPPGLETARFDYMITAEFELPLQGKIELAALAQMQPVPIAPKEVTAKTLLVNRPGTVDKPATEAVELSWKHAPQPQSYGVFRRDINTIDTLNLPRKYTAGFLPYLPSRPAAMDGEMPLDATAEFTHA
jgi:hypothetical protein